MSRDIIRRNIMSGDIMRRNIMSEYIGCSNIMNRNIMTTNSMSRYFISRNIMSRPDSGEANVSFAREAGQSTVMSVYSRVWAFGRRKSWRGTGSLWVGLGSRGCRSRG